MLQVGHHLVARLERVIYGALGLGRHFYADAQGHGGLAVAEEERTVGLYAVAAGGQDD